MKRGNGPCQRVKDVAPPKGEPRLNWALGAIAAMSLLGCGAGQIELFPGDFDGAPGQDAASDGDSDADGDTSVATDSNPALRDTGLDRSAGESGTQGGCVSDTDCNTSDASGTPRCEPALRVCVQCVSDTDCAGSSEPKCNRVSNTCSPACATNADCASPDVCDITQGACADCVQDTDCTSPGKTRCQFQECVQCVASNDCATNTTCWQNACVACVTDADCPSGRVCSTKHECT